MKKDVKKDLEFDFQKFMRDDVKRLLDARERGKLHHQGGDIVESGREVETEVRALLRRRLPGAYFVGHGHIVDTQLHQSPQCDVIIANCTDGQVLTTASSDAGYFPYESVYAIGEVKSSFRMSDLNKLIVDLKHIRTELTREKIYFSDSSGLGGTRTRLPNEPYQNPLFSFLLVVNSERLSLPSIAKIYAATPTHYLPSVFCILDKGNIFHTSWGLGANNFRFNPQPEMLPQFGFNSPESYFWPNREWSFVEHGDDATRHETNFAVFYFHLLSYLKMCKLNPAPLTEYLLKIFEIKLPEKIADLHTDLTDT